ncbi:hypothetical protein C8R46DRAFT_9412 [Mycena filopes]|nr:hypothetical protein C8R46DRAFT_9412 [Mycena filopes]
MAPDGRLQYPPRTKTLSPFLVILLYPLSQHSACPSLSRSIFNFADRRIRFSCFTARRQSEPPPPGSKRPRRRQYAAILRVYLARQVYLSEMHGRSSWRTITVGEGTVRPLTASGVGRRCRRLRGRCRLIGKGRFVARMLLAGASIYTILWSRTLLSLP